MTTQRFTFSKEERLCSENIIDSLFSKGESFVHYPFRIVYIVNPEGQDELATMMASVSKKRFKRANKRNLLKRRIREAYRLNKQSLYDVLTRNESRIALAFLYLPKDIKSSEEIHRKMEETLTLLIGKLQ